VGRARSAGGASRAAQDRAPCSALPDTSSVVLHRTAQRATQRRGCRGGAPCRGVGHPGLAAPALEELWVRVGELVDDEERDLRQTRVSELLSAPQSWLLRDQATLFKNLHRPARTDLHSRSAADFEQYHRVVQGGACAAIAQQVCAAATVATMSVATARSGARSCRSTLSSRGSAPLTCTAGTRSGSGR